MVRGYELKGKNAVAVVWHMKGGVSLNGIKPYEYLISTLPNESASGNYHAPCPTTLNESRRSFSESVNRSIEWTEHERRNSKRRNLNRLNIVRCDAESTSRRRRVASRSFPDLSQARHSPQTCSTVARAEVIELLPVPLSVDSLKTFAHTIVA